MRTITRLLASSAAVFLLLGAGRAEAVVLDDFNRPDGPGLGPSWNISAGTCQTISNQASCDELGSALYVGATSNVVSADVYSTNASNDYGALILGYANIGNSLYIKLQSQDSVAGFEAIGFYFGNNGTNNGAWSESGFVVAALPQVTQAHMVISLIGDELHLDLDTDLDNVFDFQFVRGNVPVGLLGTEIGIGGWSSASARIDNFGIGIAQASEPASLALLGLGLAALGFRRRKVAS